jgi:hypothetical protein
MLTVFLRTYITPPKSSPASLHSALPISFLRNYILSNECLLPFSKIGRISVMFFMVIEKQTRRSAWICAKWESKNSL